MLEEMSNWGRRVFHRNGTQLTYAVRKHLSSGPRLRRSCADQKIKGVGGFQAEETAQVMLQKQKGTYIFMETEWLTV